MESLIKDVRKSGGQEEVDIMGGDQAKVGVHICFKI